jgi:hypothetical protein
MLVMLGVAVFAGFDLMGTVESGGAPATTRVVTGTAAGTDKALNVADAVVAVGQAALQALTAVVTKIVSAWWPAGLLDWMQAVHRAWPSIHRLPGTGPSQR